MRAMVDLTTCLSNGSICWKVKGMIPSCQRNQGLSKWPPPSTDVPNSKRAGRSISLVQCPLRRVEWLQLQFKTGVLHLLTGRLTTGSHQVASLNLKAHIIIPQTNYLARCRVAQTHSLQFGNLSEFLSQVNMLYSIQCIQCIPIEYVEKVTSRCKERNRFLLSPSLHREETYLWSSIHCVGLNGGKTLRSEDHFLQDAQSRKQRRRWP